MMGEMSFYYLPSCTVAYQTPEGDFPSLDLAKVKEHVDTWDSYLAQDGLQNIEQAALSMLQNVTDLLTKPQSRLRYLWSDKLSYLADTASTIAKVRTYLPSGYYGKVKACVDQISEIQSVLANKIIDLYDKKIRENPLVVREFLSRRQVLAIPILNRVKVLENLNDKILDLKKIAEKFLPCSTEATQLDKILQNNVSILKVLYNEFTKPEFLTIFKFDNRESKDDEHKNDYYEAALIWSYMDKLISRPSVNLMQPSEFKLQTCRYMLRALAKNGKPFVEMAKRFIQDPEGEQYFLDSEGNYILKTNVKTFQEHCLMYPFLIGFLLESKAYKLESNEKIEKALDVFYANQTQGEGLLLKVGESYNYRSKGYVVRDFIMGVAESESPFIGLLNHYFHPRFKEDYFMALEMLSKEPTLCSMINSKSEYKESFQKRFNEISFDEVFPKEQEVTLVCKKNGRGRLYFKLSKPNEKWVVFLK